MLAVESLTLDNWAEVNMLWVDMFAVLHNQLAVLLQSQAVEVHHSWAGPGLVPTGEQVDMEEVWSRRDNWDT